LIIGVWLLGNCIYYARNEGSDKKMRIWTVSGVVILLVYLFAAKYLKFLLDQISILFKSEIKTPALLVLLGLSFIIFEAISYLVDIYRFDAGPGNLIDAALFLSLFTKLVSGPIVLWKDFEKQLRNRQVSIDGIASGIDRIIVGLAKKALIADVFGSVIVKIQAQTGRVMDRYTMWLYAVLYFFQIYYDFSGYSDIAIGLSRIFGFSFKENFNFPYTSISLSEFWRRWHISLGTWFREYVYIPLGGNRKGKVWLNLGIVFLLTGIWHGANWTFIIWGIYNGIIVVIERFIMKKNWYIKIPRILKWFLTMFLVGLGWVVFMSEDINAALTTIGSMFVPQAGIANFTWRFYLTRKVFVLLLVAAAGSVCDEFFKKFKNSDFLSSTAFVVIKRCVLAILFIVSILFIVNSSYSPFLYFQF
jgi:alginate O-acetyltransferase complex protein AlgI